MIKEIYIGFPFIWQSIPNNINILLPPSGLWEKNYSRGTALVHRISMHPHMAAFLMINVTAPQKSFLEIGSLDLKQAALPLLHKHPLGKYRSQLLA